MNIIYTTLVLASSSIYNNNNIQYCSRSNIVLLGVVLATRVCITSSKRQQAGASTAQRGKSTVRDSGAKNQNNMEKSYD